MSIENLSTMLAGMDPAEAALGAGMVVAVLGIMGILAIAWYFISAIGYFKMNKKAGEAGWKAFIPFYSTYIRFKYAWKRNIFWAFLALNILFSLFAESSVIWLSLIGLACGIAMIVLGFKLDKRIAKSFGKGTGTAVLLFFFPFIMSLVLGFGKAEYIGNTTEN